MTAIERFLPSEEATELFGDDVAAALRAGDVVALKGDLGAGKTTLARAVIRALAGDPGLDVPSPTFTLVQTYEARIPVAHFDLYRLGSPNELDELGFAEQAAEGITLIEWPERAGERLPGGMVEIELTHQDEGRLARISGSQSILARIGRSLEARDFLERSSWSGAYRAYLAGDASARSYEVVHSQGKAPAVLMNSPPLVLGPPVRGDKTYAEMAHTARTVSAFVAVDGLLHDAGFAVPQIYAQDLDGGFLVIEHLGSGSFLGPRGEPIAERYEAAAELLAELHRRPWPAQAEAAPGVMHVIPPFDRPAMMIEVELLLDWYVPAAGREPSVAERDGFVDIWNAALDRLAGTETSLMLRDVQSPNFIWREERSGFDRMGLIDFQDALIGPSAYDVASLAMDARVTIPEELERRTVEAYARARAAGSFDRAAFDEAYAVMAAQRNSKILGIFVRLHRRDGKPDYLKHLPRIRAYLRRALGHPALAQMREFYDRHGFLEERVV